MQLTKRLMPSILVVACIGIIFGIVLGLSGFIRDLNHAEVKPEGMPITVYLTWVGVVLLIGFLVGRFSLMRAFEFLSRWGMWPALLVVLLNFQPVRSLHRALLQWPGFLIWFVPLAVACLILGMREMRQKNTETRQHEN